MNFQCGFVNSMVLLIYEVSVVIVVPFYCVFPGIYQVSCTHVISGNCVVSVNNDVSVT